MTLVHENGAATTDSAIPDGPMNFPEQRINSIVSGIDHRELDSVVRLARMNAVKTDVAIATLRFEMNRMCATAERILFGGGSRA